MLVVALLDVGDSPATRAAGWWLLGIATGAAVYMFSRLYQTKGR